MPIFKIIEQPRYGSVSLLSFGLQSSSSKTNDSRIHNGHYQDIVTEFNQDYILQNRIVYQAFANVEIIYPSNDILTDRIVYELHGSNVQTARGVLVINIFNNQSSTTNDELMNQILMKNNYLSYLGMTMLKEQFFLLFFVIIFILFLIPALLIIGRLCFVQSKSKSKTQTKCMNDNNFTMAPTLTTTTTVPTTQTNQSNSTITHSTSSASFCSRPNIDHHSSVSHYSSSTAITVPNLHGSKKSSPFNLENTIDLQLLQKSNDKKYKHDEMSPLPPPSLYFINDHHHYDYSPRNRCYNQNNNKIHTDQIDEMNNEDVVLDSGESQSDDTVDIANIDDHHHHHFSHLARSYSPPFPFGSNKDGNDQNDDRDDGTTTATTMANRFAFNNCNKNQYWI